MGFRGHLVLCGFGVLGSASARAFLLSGRRPGDLCVVELDHGRCEAARKLGYRTVFGDASDLSRLRVAHSGAATEIIVCVGDEPAPTVVRSVRRVAPSARVKVALRAHAQWEAVASAGASEVVVLAQVTGIMLANSITG